MLEMRELQDSDVLGAPENHGKWGRDASKDSSEVGKPQKSMHRKRDKEVSRHSGEDRTAELGCVRGDARAAVQEREREMGHRRSHREQRPHRWCRRPQRATPWQSPADEKTELLSAKDSGEQKIHEKRTKSFHEARRRRTHEHSQQAEAREMYAAQRRLR